MATTLNDVIRLGTAFFQDGAADELLSLAITTATTTTKQQDAVCPAADEVVSIDAGSVGRLAFLHS